MTKGDQYTRLYVRERKKKGVVHYDISSRERKARTMVAVLEDFVKRPLNKLNVLDIGASTGIIDNYLSNYFERIIGIDINYISIQHAKNTYKKDNLIFYLADALNLPFSNERFDVVICSHVYEHVPDSKKLFEEIFRVLRSEGVCYFAAGNRLVFKEIHYRLPLLSVIPRPLAHFYIRMTGKDAHYDIKLLSYWGLKALVKKFRCTDYTSKIISESKKYYTDYMIPPNSFKSRMGKIVLKYLYWSSPGYIWLLQKPYSARNAIP